MKCEKCGHELEPVKGVYLACIGMTCPNCGWGFIRSEGDPMLEDVNDYTITIKSYDTNQQTLRSISKCMNINYIEAKKQLDNAPFVAFKGKAYEVIKKLQILNRGDVNYSVSPNFPWFDRVKDEG